MDTRLRIQTILLAEKIKQNTYYADKLGLKDCSVYLKSKDRGEKKCLH